MRELVTKDLFAMSRIFSKMELKIDAEGKSQTQYGADLVMSVLGNLHKAEDEVLEFIGDLKGLSAKEMAKLPLPDLALSIKELITKPGIMDFFKAAGSLTK